MNPPEKFNHDESDNSREAEIVVGNQIVRLTFNFQQKKRSNTEKQDIRRFVNQLPLYNTQNLEYMYADFAKSESNAVRKFIEFHFTLFDQDFFLNHVSAQDERAARLQLLNKIALVSLSFNVVYDKSSSGRFANFGYAFVQNDFVPDTGAPIRKIISDQLIVITTNKDGGILTISWEKRKIRK